MNSLFQTITSAQDEEKIVPMSSAPAVQKQSKIIINDLELMMFIGVFDPEKEEKQRVIVNLEIDVLPNDQWQKDDVSDVVSYADIIDRIEMMASQGHIHLVETLAEKIAEVCFSFQGINSAKIRVEKPDIIVQTKSVGTELFVQR